jgi:hypothetical protein
MDARALRRFADAHGFTPSEVAFGVSAVSLLWSGRRGARINSRLRRAAVR